MHYYTTVSPHSFPSLAPKVQYSIQYSIQYSMHYYTTVSPHSFPSLAPPKSPDKVTWDGAVLPLISKTDSFSITFFP
jgi:hypothetical protein